MRDLDKIGCEYNTDKSSLGHDYLRLYEHVLGSLREEEFNMIELGVGPSHNMGKSLLTWKKFFQNAKIIGVDIREDASSVADERITVEIGDCGNVQFLTHLAQTYRPLVVLDDASHRWSHQILSFEYLFPAIEQGGYYICEDMETSFAPWTDRKAHVDHFEDAATYYSRLNLVLMGSNKEHPSFKYRPPGAAQSALSEMIEWTMMSRGSVIVKKK